MSEQKQSKDRGGKDAYPVLPLRDIVVFPYMIVPLFVGREKSINALEEVMRADKQILLAAQKNAGDDDPSLGRPDIGRGVGSPTSRATRPVGRLNARWSPAGRNQELRCTPEPSSFARSA